MSLKQDILQKILNDETLLKAVREVFTETTKEEMPKIEKTDTNKIIGERYRAYKTAEKIIERGFINLGSYKIDKDKEDNFNKSI